MPPDGFIRIEGRSESVDLDGWIDVIIDGALGGRGMGGLELEKGSLEAGKVADIVILDKDLMSVEEGEIAGVRVVYTFVNGEDVLNRE